MDIVFKNSKFEKECNDQRLLEKKHGADRTKHIRRRLDDLRAASVLEEMRNLPGRCHKLIQNRASQLVLELDHPHWLKDKPMWMIQFRLNQIVASTGLKLLPL